MCICHYEMHLGATYPWVFVYLWTLLRSIWRIRDLLSWWRNTKQFWQKIQPKLFMIAVKDDMEYVLQTNSMIISTACCCRWGSSYPVHWKKSKLSKTWTTWRWPKDNSMFYNVLSLAPILPASPIKIVIIITVPSIIITVRWYKNWSGLR